jgi:prepilin-type N-terminal cleavage/methylation domain-containing protein
MYNQYNKIRAFTLAEILLTLVIIGIISSIVIPSVMQDIQDTQYRIAWKKTYANFAQATKGIAYDNAGSLAGAFGNDASNEGVLRNKYAEYLKYIKLCDEDTPIGDNGCWPSLWYSLPGTLQDNTTILTGNPLRHSRLALYDGTLIGFSYNSINCTGNYTTKLNGCGYAYFDINGFKKPNTIGKDIFGVYVLRDGNIIPIGTQTDNLIKPANDPCDKTKSNATGWSCSAAYLYQ